MKTIETALAEHSFEHLFIECLGWDRAHVQMSVDLYGETLLLESVAHKRGFTVFLCPTHRTVLADRHGLRSIQRQLRKSFYEHILIHFCDVPHKQVWQWSTTVSGQKQLLHREHPFFSTNPPPRLLERIQGLTIGVEEEEQTNLTDVLSRVRHVLQPDNEYVLFAKYPHKAKISDALAMAVKRGEAGALEKFIEFHIPLARHNSRRMLRWYDIDPEDAEQTAMIGLIEAARRYDPERGAQFSTYASYWIRQCCQRYGLEWGLQMRLPNHLFWPCYKMLFVEAKLVATYGQHQAREHFERELQKSGISHDNWMTFCNARSVDRFADIEKTQRHKVADNLLSLQAEDLAGENERNEIISRALEMLKPRQARILQLRYGFGSPEYTLQQIGELLGITRERVRQIQEKSEQKLLKILEHHGYHECWHKIQSRAGSAKESPKDIV